MANRLPARWRAWITELVEKVDYDKQTQQEELVEQVVSTLENGLRARQARAVRMESLRTLRVFT